MDLLSAAIFGGLQGFTEWLPISSSGQLTLAMVNGLNMDLEEALAMAFYLHIGTMLSVIVRFRRDVFKLVKAVPRFREDTYLKFMTVATLSSFAVALPIFLAYLYFIDDLTGEGITIVTGIFLILTGVVIYRSQTKGVKNLTNTRTRDMIIAGAAQGLAVIPGVSRSAMTLGALLGMDYDHRLSLKMSFIMSIPAVLALSIVEIRFVPAYPVPIAVGITVAFLVSYATIDILMVAARKIRFDIFCVSFGAIAAGVGLVVMLH